MKRIKQILIVVKIIVFWLVTCMCFEKTVLAGDIFQSPYVSITSDKEAWTTCKGETHNEHYPMGYTVETGVFSAVGEPMIGEHYYTYARTGNIPVGKWEVNWANSGCIHNRIDETQYHGMSFSPTVCGEEYTQGWFAFCADCGQKVVTMLIYLCEDAARDLDSIPTGMDYYYACPHCNHLEQGATIYSHTCQKISPNRYTVKYEVNTEMEYIGFPPTDTYHMYNNATTYEGMDVIPVTRLAKMQVTIPGYAFVGWNSDADGSGEWFESESEIYNLTPYDSGYDERGIVSLYAQWERSESTLLIQPAGGTYFGNEGITSYKKYAYEQQVLYPEGIGAPQGAILSFQVGGGEYIAPIKGGMYFERWEASLSFEGSLVGNVYTFPEKNGVTDVLTAVYQPTPIVLPEARRENFSFGGWYYNTECTNPAGQAGDSIVIEKDTVLYAYWVELILDSVENYIANDGKGAVDLSWSQPDTYQKSYLVYRYQSEGGTDVPDREEAGWSQVTTSTDGVAVHVEENVTFSGGIQKYTIPYTGFYLVRAAGAQGENYGDYRGGTGGIAEAKFWLQEGDILTYTVGGCNGYGGGGEASLYGNGGGATVVESDEWGVLIVAAGGGGATENSDGGNGGESLMANLLPTGYSGENGMAGGGGGYYGGKAGTYLYHTHTVDQCGYHAHQGNVADGGECYTRSVKQGVCSPQKRGLADTATWACGTCGGTVTQLHYYAGGTCHNAISGKTEHDYYEEWCDGTCGLDESWGLHSHTYTYYTYTFDCTLTVGFQCGKSDEIAECAEAAYGGSSYVNIIHCVEYTYIPGSNFGDGYVEITSEKIGFWDHLKAQGVAAPDLAGPDMILKSAMSIMPVAGQEGTEILVKWEPPLDCGTDYYFRVDSYSIDTGEFLATSNIRKHSLITGVTGYFYAISTQENYLPIPQNMDYLADNALHLQLGREVQYLHIMPVDAAGNTGKMSTIRLGALSVGEVPDVIIPWPVHTQQMQVGNQDGVWKAQETDTYYVRCDNITPIELSFTAYMEGVATNAYQITDVYYVTGLGGEKVARFGITTPLHEISEGEIVSSGNGLQFETEGIALFKPYMYAVTIRSEENKEMTAISRFLPSKEMEGKKTYITPAAAVRVQGYCITSSEEEDIQHGIYLIGDGTAPVVRGNDRLDEEAVWEQKDGMVIELYAEDELSGLNCFYAEIFNAETGNYCRYDADDEGRIILDFQEDKLLFAGEFVVTLIAVDNVGNVYCENYHITGLGLEIRVERIAAPYTPMFKRGESGYLFIETWGYVERIVVEFPEGFHEYSMVFEYVTTKYKEDEKIRFMVPLYGTEDGEYEIYVRAYKGEDSLVDSKCFTVSGTVLDEMRTRLR